MKKALTGCLVVVVLALVLGAGGLWWFVLRPAWDAGSALVGAAEQWQQLAELEAEVAEDDAGFAGPADGRLQAEQVARFVAVQQHIAAALGEDWKTLEAKYQAMEAQQDAEGREPDMAEALGAWEDLSGILLAAKRAQVDALNEAGMGLNEYRWVRDQAYMALGLASSDAAPPPALADSAMAHNAQLLRPHAELLQKTLATAWLGF